MVRQTTPEPSRQRLEVEVVFPKGKLAVDRNLEIVPLDRIVRIAFDHRQPSIAGVLVVIADVALLVLAAVVLAIPDEAVVRGVEQDLASPVSAIDRVDGRQINLVLPEIEVDDEIARASRIAGIGDAVKVEHVVTSTADHDLRPGHRLNDVVVVGAGGQDVGYGPAVERGSCGGWRRRGDNVATMAA